MIAAEEQVLQQAIATISQSDPLVKLVQQVRVGRMQPTDPGLRAITEAWLATYAKMVSLPGLTRAGLKRIDPFPRTTELIQAGILSPEHPAVASLTTRYAEAYASAAH